MQRRKHSVLEAATSTVIGCIVSYVLQWFLYPLYGFHITHTQNLQLLAIFTIVSVIRSYSVRRFFNRLHHVTGK